MVELDIEFLLKTSVRQIAETIQPVFDALIQQVRHYLNLEPVFSRVSISLEEKLKTVQEGYMNSCLNRYHENGSLFIIMDREFEKFIRIILLREAYRCFFPVQLQDIKIIHPWIIQKVGIDLHGDDALIEWNNTIGKKSMSYDDMQIQSDKLQKFLNQKSSDKKSSPFQFACSYMRKYIQTVLEFDSVPINSQRKHLYDKIFETYVAKYEQYSESMVETIRIIKEIFFKVRTYHSALEYETYFKEFKSSGDLETEMSQREFHKNMELIKNSSIAPSYRMNWFAFNLISAWCFMKFHPVLEPSKIYKVLEHLPFFIIPRYTKNGFSVSVHGYFIFPRSYLSDIYNLFKKLEGDGILIEKKFVILKSGTTHTNLNCFRDGNKLLNLKETQYRKELELTIPVDYPRTMSTPSLDLFDWVLSERIRSVSETGLGFERKGETLSLIKKDLVHEIESQRGLISRIEKSFNLINESEKLNRKFMDMIETKERKGFFYILQMLRDYIMIFDQIKKLLKRNPPIYNIMQLQEYIKNHGISSSIANNINFKEHEKFMLGEIFPLYFTSNKQFTELVKQYQIFHDLFEAFNDLKIFDLNKIKIIITEKNYVQQISEEKNEKLKKEYEPFKAYKMEYSSIEKKIEEYLNNKLINPSLGGTITLMSKVGQYVYYALVNDTDRMRESIERIKWQLPHLSITHVFDHESSEKFILLVLRQVKLNLKEKEEFSSFLRTLFKEDIVFNNIITGSLFNHPFTVRDYYDLSRKSFFYTKDLFKDYLNFIEAILEEVPLAIRNSQGVPVYNSWATRKSTYHLRRLQEKKLKAENVDLSIDNLKRLKGVNDELNELLLNTSRFREFKDTFTFKNYVKSINFFPSFQSFGIEQYFLYFFATDLNQIDMRHFLHNSFQKVKIPIGINYPFPFLISYIWPYRNPNVKVLNWLTKAKGVIREYCLFNIKRTFQLFHFDNLEGSKWEIEPDLFKEYYQKVLFNPTYNPPLHSFKKTDVNHLNLSHYFSPESPEYKALTKVYARKSLDIKSFLLSNKYPIIYSFLLLLKKNLIMPYISWKNLGIKGTTTIILPNVPPKHNEKLHKIFQFFNLGFIHEIEGKYYIQGLDNEIKFENGFMIKLYLPSCLVGQLQTHFDQIFTYLGIKHYVILNDLIESKSLLKSIFGDVSFLNEYNPLKNLIWTEKDKKWRNNKLYTKEFKEIYPPLIKVE